MTSIPLLLPEYILVKLSTSSNTITHVLIRPSLMVDTNGVQIWNIELCRNPLDYLKGGVLKEDGIPIPFTPYKFWRKSTVLESSLYRTKQYIVKDSKYIPEYIIYQAYTILPIEVMKVYNNINSKEYSFLLQTDIPKAIQQRVESQVRPIEKPTVIIQKEYKTIYVSTKKIPTHIFRMVVEKAEKEKEECPITMESIEKRMVGGTPCGHLFDKRALEKVVKESKKCPTCRAEVRLEDIQIYE